MSFTLEAVPGTDIWRKPPTTDVFDGPTKAHSEGPLKTFSSALVTFTGKYTVLYDQAGILFTLTHPSKPRRWIKTGIEFYQGFARLSTVACETWADWSVSPADHAADIAQGKAAVTISVEKETSGQSTSIWIYQLDGQGEKTALREICWVFADEGGEGWELEVSAMAMRPSKAEDAFVATFDKLEVKWE